MRSGPSAIDQAAGMLAFSGALAALLARERGKGGGEHVEISLLDAGIALLSNVIPTYTVGGQLPRRSGSGLWHLVPYQVFNASDGQMLIGVTNDATWSRFCASIGQVELASDERFITNTDRVKNHDELITLISGLLAARSLASWDEQFQDFKIPFSRVNTLDQMLAEEQVKSRGAIINVCDKDGKTLQLVSMPIKFATKETVSRLRPPNLGEHTDEVLRNCGFDGSAITRLRADGIIR
jgi:Predicted acyl-CoA transferases/carnitine dehydratase